MMVLGRGQLTDGTITADSIDGIITAAPDYIGAEVASNDDND
jgi:hypothetical protein